MKIKVKLSAILMFSLLMLCSLSVYATGSGKPTNDVKVEVKNGMITMSTSQKDAEIIYATAQKKDPGADDWNYNMVSDLDNPEKFKSDGSNWYKYEQSLVPRALGYKESAPSKDAKDSLGTLHLYYAIKTKDGVSDTKYFSTDILNTKVDADVSVNYSESGTAAVIVVKAKSKLAKSGKETDCNVFYVTDTDTEETTEINKDGAKTLGITENGTYVFEISDCYGGYTITTVTITDIKSSVGEFSDKDIVKDSEDKNPPEIKIESKDGVTYTVVVKDDVALGRADSPTGMTYSMDNDEKELTFTFTASSNGTWSVTAYDKVGNKATKSVDVKSVSVKDSQKEQRDKSKSKQSDKNVGEEDPTDSFDKADTLPQTGGIAKYVIIAIIALLIVGGFTLYYKGGLMNGKKNSK